MDETLNVEALAKALFETRQEAFRRCGHKLFRIRGQIVSEARSWEETDRKDAYREMARLLLARILR